MAFAVGSVVVICLQTAIAISSDNISQANLLATTILSQGDSVGAASAEIQGLATDFEQTQPVLLQWVICLLTRIGIMITSFELIRREQ